MTEKLIDMYRKGAITADHVAVEALRQMDPKSPETALGKLPAEILERILAYASEYRPGQMKSNYGGQPTANQVEAAKEWIEAKVVG